MWKNSRRSICAGPNGVVDFPKAFDLLSTPHTQTAMFFFSCLLWKNDDLVFYLVTAKLRGYWCLSIFMGFVIFFLPGAGVF